ncbi:uncharacterized protein LOC144165047 [Haemaphysalis longicornis]
MKPGYHLQNLFCAMGIFLTYAEQLNAHKVEPMDGFEPEKFLGKWWFVRLTASVFHQNEQCAHFTVARKEDRIYNITSEFSLSGGRKRRLTVDLEDDMAHPAQFTASVNDKPVVWVTVLGTDYDHWAVLQVQEGTYVTSGVASRKQSLDAAFDEAVLDIVAKNKISEEFQMVPTKDCPDDI